MATTRYRRTASNLETSVRASLADVASDYQQRIAEFDEALEFAGPPSQWCRETVAEYIRGSALRAQLVAALEDRAFVAFTLKDLFDEIPHAQVVGWLRRAARPRGVAAL